MQKTTSRSRKIQKPEIVDIYLLSNFSKKEVRTLILKKLRRNSTNNSQFRPTSIYETSKESQLKSSKKLRQERPR